MSIHRFQLTVGCDATGVVLLYDLPLGLFESTTNETTTMLETMIYFQKCEGKILLPVSLMGQCGAEDRRSEDLIVADQKTSTRKTIRKGTYSDVLRRRERSCFN